ncbi:MAG TPA: hypothetical protein VGP71_11530 [Burkholderiales bacterium]|nr:hypothetical protein [Burkholderiales bacterium]
MNRRSNFYAEFFAKLDPLSIAFAVLVVVASIYLPPYRIDLDHWYPLIAASTAIGNGLWPYVSGYDSGYGLLCPAFLALWLFCFGLSALSLTAIIMLSNLVAGIASFTLIRRLTGSPLLALVGALYPLQGINPYVLAVSRDFAVSSSFRAPVQITLCALLLYLSLRRKRARFVPAFLFGLMVLWDPLFGAFAAAGFVFAHGYLFVHGTGAVRATHARTLASMFGGIALPLAAIAALHGAVWTNLLETYSEISATGRLAVLGYANLPQQFDPIVTVAFLVAVPYLALVVRRLSLHRRLTRTDLFLGATLIAAVPRVLYALGRSDAVHYLPLYWALIPCAALLIGLVLRVRARRFGARSTVPGMPVPAERAKSAIFLIGLIVCAYFWGSFPLDRILGIDNFALRYEGARRAWQRGCAAGDSCSKDDEPSLHKLLQRASEPLQKTGVLGIDPVLLAACRDGLPVLSYADAWIYATADCYSPLRIPAIAFPTTGTQFERTVRMLAGEPHVLLDPVRSRYADWKGEPLSEIKARLIGHGFTETDGCGRFSVMSKADPAPVLRRLCG